MILLKVFSNVLKAGTRRMHTRGWDNLVRVGHLLVGLALGLGEQLPGGAQALAVLLELQVRVLLLERGAVLLAVEHVPAAGQAREGRASYPTRAVGAGGEIESVLRAQGTLGRSLLLLGGFYWDVGRSVRKE